MAIRLKKDVEQKMIRSIRRYCAENLEEEIGDLKASLLLEFCLEEICPTVYNQAIADAQAFLQEKIGDLENSRFAIEFGYWDKHGKKSAEGEKRGGTGDHEDLAADEGVGAGRSAGQTGRAAAKEGIATTLPFPPSSP